MCYGSLRSIRIGVNGQRSNTLCHVCVIVLNTPHASSPEQEELDGGRVSSRDRSTAVGPRSKNYTHTHISMSVSVSILSQYPTCFYTTSHHCISVYRLFYYVLYARLDGWLYCITKICMLQGYCFRYLYAFSIYSCRGSTGHNGPTGPTGNPTGHNGSRRVTTDHDGSRRVTTGHDGARRARRARRAETENF